MLHTFVGAETLKKRFTYHATHRASGVAPTEADERSRMAHGDGRFHGFEVKNRRHLRNVDWPQFAVELAEYRLHARSARLIHACFANFSLMVVV